MWRPSCRCCCLRISKRSECISLFLFLNFFLPRPTYPLPTHPPVATHLVHHGNVVGFPDAHAYAVRPEGCLRGYVPVRIVRGDGAGTDGWREGRRE